MSVIDAPRICPVCKDEIIEATKASYVTYKAMPVLFHTDCLYALDEAIRESKQPIKPVHKAEPMQKHDRSTVNRAIVENALQNLINGFIDSGQQPSGVMALALDVLTKESE